MWNLIEWNTYYAFNRNEKAYVADKKNNLNFLASMMHHPFGFVFR